VSLEEHLAEAERCGQCSYCKWIPLDQIKSWRFANGCPSIAYNNFNSYSARGRYLVAHSLLNGRSEYTDRVLDIVYKCVTCGNCDVACKIGRYNMEPLEMIHDLRFKLVEEGQLLPQHMIYIDHLRKEDNMMLKPRSERGQWAEGLGLKQITREGAEVLFHAGCRFSYDLSLRSKVRAAATLLRDAGVDLGILGSEESCCGGRVFNMGYKGEFTKFAENNLQVWKGAGVKTIVTSCSDCYHSFKRLYPTLGSGFKVVHTVEYLDSLIREGKIKPQNKVPLKVTYHDPCHLGRQGEPYVPWEGKEKKLKNQIVVFEPRKPRYNGAWGVYDPPRNVLKSIPGLELVEMERIREYAWCCGSGGGVKEAYPEFSAWTASERILEAASTGAQALVSACGWCENNFAESVAQSGQKLEVFDVAELVLRSVQGKGE
jgi:Fe-S oxidoreductase